MEETPNGNVFMGHRGWRGRWSGGSWLLLCGLSSNGARRGLSAESLPGLERACLAPWLKTDVRCRQTRHQTYGHEGAMLTGDWHRCLLLRRLNQGPLPWLAFSTPSTALRRRSGTRPRALGKPAEQAFRRLDVFRERFS